MQDLFGYQSPGIAGSNDENPFGGSKLFGKSRSTRQPRRDAPIKAAIKNQDSIYTLRGRVERFKP